MMQRALHNLLGNAMHHIGPDGVFVLRAFACPEGVRVEVEDHGPGISAEDLPYIFDRYYRSRSDAGKTGTGLGLSITKAIFQQHGFRFGVQSAPGQRHLLLVHHDRRRTQRRNLTEQNALCLGAQRVFVYSA